MSQAASSSNGPAGQRTETPINENHLLDEEVTCTAKCCYYTFGFLAHWFGSARFDMDGDGEFDAADVQMMLNKPSEFLHLSLTRPPQNKRVRLKRKKMREEAAKKKDQAGDSMSLGETMQDTSALLAANVEGEEAEEDEIADNLKQYLPWFCIVQVLICFISWAYYAGWHERAYTKITSRVAVLEENVLSEYTMNGTMFKENCQHACNSDDECVGIGFQRGPYPACKLLSTLPEESEELSIKNCPTDSFNWEQYKKEPFSLMGLMKRRGGLDSYWPGHTALRSHYYCEDTFRMSFLWRWWSYQFTHGGLSHVGSNSLMTLVLGIPLEGLHGTLDFAIMWTTGVFGGACNWLLVDPYRRAYGASGGCYSLLGMHVADLIMNWSQKKFRFPIMVLLVIITAVEAGGYYMSRDSPSTTAHAVHLGGGIAGMFIGVCVGRNIHEEKWEKVVQILCWVIGLGLAAASLLWWFFRNPFPGISTAWDPLERPWCWIGEVCIGDDGGPCPWRTATGAKDFGETFSQCVFCDTRDCVLGWYNQTRIRKGLEAYSYCPRSATQDACHPYFDDRWDLFYPPDHSMFQIQ